jgi:hypothetical protein
MLVLSFDVGIINLAYCIFNTNTCKINHWEIIKINTDNLYINLIKELDLRKHLLDVEIVLIEKQPSFNPKMRIIAGCLQTYFFIRGMVDQIENPIKSVEFFSPKNKLKCYTGPLLTIESKTKSKYSKTKKMGILIAESKLNQYSESIENKELFRTTNKKDDLSDCYLQALTWSTFKKLINITPEITFTSINTFKTDLKEILSTGSIVLSPMIIKYLLDNYQITEVNKITILPVLTELRMKSFLKLFY